MTFRKSLIEIAHISLERFLNQFQTLAFQRRTQAGGLRLSMNLGDRLHHWC